MRVQFPPEVLMQSQSKFKSQKIVDLLFEAATLKRLKRTGWQILGENEESVAEHSFIVAVIGYTLAIQLKADVKKVLIMALFHDFSETRTGDVYKLADLYVRVNEKKANQDAFSNLANSKELIDITNEYEKASTLESKIVHDADTLALCIELKQLMEKGNIHAKEWFEANIKRLKLDESIELAKQIKYFNSQDWWKKERQIIHKGYRK